LRELLNILNAGKTILVTDYCSTQSKWQILILKTLMRDISFQQIREN
jgi:hypothetical protein